MLFVLDRSDSGLSRQVACWSFSTGPMLFFLDRFRAGLSRHVPYWSFLDRFLAGLSRQVPCRSFLYRFLPGLSRQVPCWFFGFLDRSESFDSFSAVSTQFPVLVSYSGAYLV